MHIHSITQQKLCALSLAIFVIVIGLCFPVTATGQTSPVSTTVNQTNAQNLLRKLLVQRAILQEVVVESKTELTGTATQLEIASLNAKISEVASTGNLDPAAISVEISTGLYVDDLADQLIALRELSIKETVSELRSVIWEKIATLRDQIKSELEPAYLTPLIPTMSTPLDTSRPRRPYEFGKDYLRVYVTGVNLPNSRDKQSFFVVVSTGNKINLEFKAAFEPRPRTKVSAYAEIPIVPYVALNTKAPLIVYAELRRKKRYSEPFDLVSGLLSTAGSIFGGGALSTVTTLGTYAKATGDLVKEYETRTESTDLNGGVIFDDAEVNEIEANKMAPYIFVFTGGDGYFTAYKVEDGEGKPKEVRITEGMIVSARPVNNLEDGKEEMAWKLEVRTTPDESDQTTTVYLLKNQPFIIVSYEVYTRYPNIADRPEVVKAVVPFFEGLAELYNTGRALSQPEEPAAPSNGAPASDSLQSGDGATEPTADAEEHDEDIAIDAVVAKDGKALYEVLKTLTDAGDLSLYDAGEVFGVYIDRAKEVFNDATKFKSEKYLLKLKNYFNVPRDFFSSRKLGRLRE